MPIPEILIVAPPPITTPIGQPLAPKFEGGPARCDGIAEAYREVAAELGCLFFNAASVVSSSSIDGVHLDADQHQRLGGALAKVVAGVLAGVA
jgi:lysophospholipase L1-like esterase